MTQAEHNLMSCLVYRIRKKGFQVDDTERIIYYNYQNPEVINQKTIKQLRKKYNFHCQAQI